MNRHFVTGVTNSQVGQHVSHKIGEHEPRVGIPPVIPLAGRDRLFGFENRLLRGPAVAIQPQPTITTPDEQVEVTVLVPVIAPGHGMLPQIDRLTVRFDGHRPIVGHRRNQSRRDVLC